MIGTAEYFRAIRGPVLLVGFGVLMLLQQLNVMGFSKTWPVLLIVWGVMELLHRVVVRPASGGLS
jgi:hypothetical protein